MTRSSKVALGVALGVLLLAAATFRMTEDARATQAMKLHALMEVKLEHSELGVALAIRVTSHSDQAIRLYQDSLPWAAWHSMVLVAVKPNRHGEPLDRYMPVDDPSPTIINLNPGKEIVGRVALKERFPDLARVLRETDVLVFWSYQLRPIDGVPLERQGGWLLIPKSGE